MNQPTYITLKLYAETFHANARPNLATLRRRCRDGHIKGAFQHTGGGTWYIPAPPTFKNTGGGNNPGANNPGGQNNPGNPHAT